MASAIGEWPGDAAVGRFEGGWVKLYRSAVTEDIGTNPNCLALWIHLLSLASVYESKTRLNGAQVELAPGTIVTGLEDLQEMSGIPKTTIYRQLKYLETTGRINRKSGNEGSIITICNWEKYQAVFSDAENERKTSGKRAENGRTPNEEYKNIRKKEEDVSAEGSATPEPLAACGRADLTKIFQDRNVKQRQLDAWMAAYPEPDWVFQEILKAVAWEASNPKNRKKDFPRFIGLWLGRGWDRRPRSSSALVAPYKSNKREMTQAEKESFAEQDKARKELGLA